jgi:hypothetical protein
LRSTDVANVSSSYSPVDAPALTETPRRRDAFLGLAVIPPALRRAWVWPHGTRQVVGFVIVPIIVAYIGADAFEYARGTCERAVLVCVRRPCVTNTSRCVIMHADEATRNLRVIGSAKSRHIRHHASTTYRPLASIRRRYTPASSLDIRPHASTT